MRESRPTILRLDEEDRIVSFDVAWVRFALENGAPELTRPSLLGLSVWGFIQGEGLRDRWDGIFDRVRQSRWPVEVPLRCDSSTLRRTVAVQVVPRGPRDIEMRTFTLSEASQEAPLLSTSAERSSSTITLCSHCQGVQRGGNGSWQPFDEFLDGLGALRHSYLPSIERGLCAKCEALLERLGNVSDRVRIA